MVLAKDRVITSLRDQVNQLTLEAQTARAVRCLSFFLSFSLSLSLSGISNLYTLVILMIFVCVFVLVQELEATCEELSSQHATNADTQAQIDTLHHRLSDQQESLQSVERTVHLKDEQIKQIKSELLIEQKQQLVQCQTWEEQKHMYENELMQARHIQQTVTRGFEGQQAVLSSAAREAVDRALADKDNKVQKLLKEFNELQDEHTSLQTTHRKLQVQSIPKEAYDRLNSKLDSMISRHQVEQDERQAEISSLRHDMDQNYVARPLFEQKEYKLNELTVNLKGREESLQTVRARCEQLSILVERTTQASNLKDMEHGKLTDTIRQQTSYTNNLLNQLKEILKNLNIFAQTHLKDHHGSGLGHGHGGIGGLENVLGEHQEYTDSQHATTTLLLDLSLTSAGMVGGGSGIGVSSLSEAAQDRFTERERERDRNMDAPGHLNNSNAALSVSQNGLIPIPHLSREKVNIEPALG